MQPSYNHIIREPQCTERGSASPLKYRATDTEQSITSFTWHFLKKIVLTTCDLSDFTSVGAQLRVTFPERMR